MSETCVYFIKSANSRSVKIGCTENVASRLSANQVGSVARLTLLALMPGDERYERAIHERFAEYRIRGEWFRLKGELETFVSLLPAYQATQAPPRHRLAVKSEMDPMPPWTVRQWAFWDKAHKDAMRFIGIDRFMRATGMPDSKRHLIVGWLENRVRSNGVPYEMPAKWVCGLLHLSDEHHKFQILRSILEPLGYETPRKETEREQLEREAREANARVRIKRIQSLVLERLGPEKLAEMEAHLDEKEAESWRARWADPDYIGPTEEQMQWAHRNGGPQLPRGIKPWPAPDPATVKREPTFANLYRARGQL